MNKDKKQTDYRDLMKSALIELEKMQAKLNKLENEKLEPIAIIGLGSRFSGAETTEQFWQNLESGTDSITDIPSDRWDVEHYFDTNKKTQGKMYTKSGSFLDHVDKFDANFFNITPREAISMDPQQRLLLEVCWEALESANIAPDQLQKTKTGVFVGITMRDYSQLSNDHSLIDLHTASGSSVSVASGRLAYLLGTQGPTMTVDTACSSSLVSVHLACQSLRLKESDLAVASGVNLILSPFTNIVLCSGNMLSPDGRCNTFDSSANGFARGEGCGSIVLKRLSDAKRDGDNIIALLRGTACNHNGKSSGLTVPSVSSQAQVINDSLKSAGVNAGDINYIEAHGTGTELGDPIEVSALAKAYGKTHTKDKPLLIGSVKTNIGHLEGAAGIAGLIKTCLCLKHEAISPHLHLKTPNPHIAWDELPISIPTQLTPWKRGEKPRLAGVSSFGFSGTNAHIIIEEAPLVNGEVKQEQDAIQGDRQQHLLTLSAKKEKSLKALAQKYIDYLNAAETSDSLGDISYTSHIGRSHFNHRLSIVGDSKQQWIEQLNNYLNTAESSNHQGTVAKQSKIAFLYTGQGSQYPDMCKELFDSEEVFRESLLNSESLLSDILEYSLTNVLYGEHQDKLSQTQYTQPALFSIEIALTKLWKSWGIEADYVMGHSLGEYVAACECGVMSVEDGLKLVSERGRLMQALPNKGSMLSALGSEQTILKIVNQIEGLEVSAYNAPGNLVISGEQSLLNDAEESLTKASVKCKSLNVSAAFHSALVEPMLEEFSKVLDQIKLLPAKKGFISNLTGQEEKEEVAQKSYWLKHIREAVNYRAGINHLAKVGVSTFIEIGPQPILLGLARQSAGDETTRWIPSARQNNNNHKVLMDALAELYISGANINWLAVDQSYTRNKIQLPTYAFQRERYWLYTDERKHKNKAHEDFFYKLQWSESRDIKETSEVNVSQYLVFFDEKGIAKEYVNHLRQLGNQVICIYKGDAFNELEKDSYSINANDKSDIIDLFNMDIVSNEKLEHIVHFWNVDTDNGFTNGETHNKYDDGIYSIINLVQACAQQAASCHAKIWLITQNAIPVNNSNQNISIHQAPTIGLAKVIAVEHDELFGGLIDLPTEVTHIETQHLYEDVNFSNGKDIVAYRNHKRMSSQLVRYKIDRSVKILLNKKSTYLITGGLGRLGLVITEWLIAQGVKSIALVALSPANETTQNILNNLRQHDVEIDVFVTDVSNYKDLEMVFSALNEKNKTVSGIFHAAGVLDNATIINHDREKFNNTLQPKIYGATNLVEIVKNQAIDFLYFFSSIASVMGAPGQSNYSAANAFMDTFAQYAQDSGVPALSIHWGAWKESGMAADTISQGYSMPGIHGMLNKDALSALNDLITHNIHNQESGIVVSKFNWQEMSEIFSNKAIPRLLSQLIEPSVLKQNTIFNDLQKHTKLQRSVLIKENVLTSLSSVNNMTNDDDLINQHVFDLGMDSLIIMEFIDKIKNDLKIMLYPKEIYEYPAINELSHYIINIVEQTHFGEKQDSDNHQQTLNTLLEKNNVEDEIIEVIKDKISNAGVILSSPRAGSTLLRVMLAGHDDLFCPPELHLLPFAHLKDWNESLKHSDFTQGLQRAVMELKSINAEDSKALLDEWVQFNLPISDVYRRLTALADNKLLLDKSPTYAIYPKALKRSEAIFDNAKYVHLVRHPYSVIESFVNMRMDKLLPYKTTNPYKAAEDIWLSSNKNILEFFDGLPKERKFVIKYEDIVLNPEEEIKKLCSFLNVPFDASTLDPYKGERMTGGIYDQSQPIGDPNFLSHKNIDANLAEKWKNIILPEPLTEETNKIAEKFGYEIADNSKSYVSKENVAQYTSIRMQEDYHLINGLNLCVCSWGKKEDPVIFLLHGMLEQGAVWEITAQIIASHGYRVIAPDLRGHGKSGHVGAGGNYHLQDYVADVQLIIDKYIFDEPITLIGHSMGSVVAALYASIQKNKLSQLILIETVLPRDNNTASPLEKIRTQIDYLVREQHHNVFKNIEEAEKRLIQMIPALTTLVANKLVSRIIVENENGYSWSWDKLLSTRSGLNNDLFSLHDYLELLSEIDIPVSLIYGKDSHFYRTSDADKLVEAFPINNKTIISGGHHLPIDSPIELADSIMSALIINNELVN